MADVARVVVALVLEDVTCRLDVVTGLHITPHDYLDRCVGFEVLVDDELRSVSKAEWHELGAGLQPLQRSLLRVFATWGARERTEHGTRQYANNLWGFMAVAGFDVEETRRLAIAPIEHAGAEYVDRLLRGDHPRVWEHLASEASLPAIAP
jgi:hypothetical protein